MDSSITENYLDYNSDQFDTWLKDFDTQQDSSEDEVYTDVSVSSVVNRRKKKNSIFVKPAPKRRPKQKQIETTIEYSEPKVTRRRKVPLFFLRKRRTTKSNILPETETKIEKKPIRRNNPKNQINWDKININDLNLILPKL